MIVLPITKNLNTIIWDRDIALSRKPWHLCNGYASRSIGTRADRSRVYLHQKIAQRALGDCPENMVPDHINGDKLDNRRGNLRYVTRSDNGKNTAKTRAKIKKSKVTTVTHISDRLL